MSEEQAQQEQQPNPSAAEMMQLMHQQGQQIATLTEQLNQANQKFEEIGKPQETEVPLPRATEEELECMTNAQLVNHLENKLGMAIQNAVGAAMEPVSNDLAATQKYMQNNNANTEIHQMMQRYSDFQPLSNEIADIIQDRSQHGYNVSMEDAYHIAKANNPDKVAKIEQESAPSQPRLAGGLLPTSRMIGETNNKQDMNFESAMDKAFKEEVQDQGLSQLFDESGISLNEIPESQS